MGERATGFGEVGEFALTPEERAVIFRRRKTKKNGYAWLPGTGPEGETCGTCAHRTVNRGKYSKCLLNPKRGNGAGTDIVRRSPACKFWKKIDE